MPACSAPDANGAGALASPAAARLACDYDESPARPIHRRIALAGSIGVFSDGYGLGIIGIALARAASPLELDALWQGLLGGASLLGLFAGALLTGPLADRHGRRRIFAFNMLLLGALSLLQSLAHSALALLLFRLAIGFLLGTDYVVSKALLTELLPRRTRGRALAMLSIAWAGGYACAYAVGFALEGAGTDSWRLMLATSALPCLLILPLRFRIPESPLWLMRAGRPAEAAAVLSRGWGEAVRLPALTPGAPARGGRWRALWSAPWRRRTAVACVFFTCQVIPYFALGTFVAQVMAALALHNAHLAALLYNLALLLGAAGGLLLVDRLARRTFLIGSFALTAVCLALVSRAPGLGAPLTVALFAVFAAVLSAASNLVYVYLPELFPTDLRASGIGMAIASSRTGSAFSTFLLPIIVESYGVRTALDACVAVLAIGGVLCALWAPETRNVPLGALDAAAASLESPT